MLPDKLTGLMAECNELIAILTTIVKKVKSRSVKWERTKPGLKCDVYLLSYLTPHISPFLCLTLHPSPFLSVSRGWIGGYCFRWLHARETEFVGLIGRNRIAATNEAKYVPQSRNQTGVREQCTGSCLWHCRCLTLFQVVATGRRWEYMQLH